MGEFSPSEMPEPDFSVDIPDVEPSIDIPEEGPAFESSPELGSESEPSAEAPLESEPTAEIVETESEAPPEASGSPGEGTVETEDDRIPEHPHEIGAGTGINPSWDRSPDEALNEPFDGMTVGQEGWAPLSTEAEGDQGEMSTPLEKATPELLPANETEATAEVHSDSEPSPDVPPEMERSPEAAGEPRYYDQGEGEFVVGPEQTELYHSPETTREIEPGVGQNPSWDQPPDGSGDESADPTKAEIEVEKSDMNQNDTFEPSEPDPSDVKPDVPNETEPSPDIVDSQPTTEKTGLREEGASEQSVNASAGDAAGQSGQTQTTKFTLDGKEVTLPGAGEREYRIGSPHADFEDYKGIVEAERQHDLAVAAQTSDSLGEAVGTLAEAGQGGPDFTKMDEYFYGKLGSAPYTDAAYPQGEQLAQSVSGSEVVSTLDPSQGSGAENTLESAAESADVKIRNPINKDFAGHNYGLEEGINKKVEKSDFIRFDGNKVKLDADELTRILKSGDVAEKYPEGVDFDSDGYADFSPYAIATVQVEGLTGISSDFGKANKAAGLSEKPKGYTWHHHQDGKTMVLVPTDLHGEVKHTGGASILRQQNKSK